MTHLEEKGIDPEDQVAVYQHYFINREDTNPIQILKEGKIEFKRRKMPSVSKMLESHWIGDETWGVYSYGTDGTSKWLCLDFDFENDDYQSRANDVKYTVAIIKSYFVSLGVPDSAVRLEFSGKKGVHLWIFLDKPIDVYQIQAFWAEFDTTLPALPLKVHFDYFPHRTCDPEGKEYGHAVKLPTGWHKGTDKFLCFMNDDLDQIDSKEALQSVEPWQFPERPPFERKPTTKGRKGPRDATKGKTPVTLSGSVPIPSSDTRIDRLFRRCAFMEGFQNDPDTYTHQQWSHAGLVLTQFDQIGKKWFTNISARDSARFDGSHELLISNVQRRGLLAPSCKTIGCDLCELRSPLQAAYPNTERSRPVWIGDQEANETLTIETFREELRQSLEQKVKEGKSKIYLIKAPMGAGKSTAMMNICQALGKKVMWWSPTYNQLEEISDKLKDVPSKVEGLSKKIANGMHCPHFKEMQDRMKAGLPNERLICNVSTGKCKNRVDCKYQQQFRSEKRSTFTLGVHASLSVSQAKLKNMYADREIVVFDECFLDHYRKEITFTKENVQNLKEALGKGRDKIIKKWIQPLQDLISGTNDELLLQPLHIENEVFSSVVKRFETDFQLKGRNILGDLIKASKHKAHIKKTTTDGQTRLWFSRDGYLPLGLPIFILDGTADLDTYKGILGSEFEIELVEPLGNRQIKQHVYITQVLSGSYPNASLIKDNLMTPSATKITEFIKKQITGSDSVGIISTLQMKDLLKAELGKENIEYGHFNSIRGLNSMENKKILFVVGYQGLDWKEIVKQARIKFDLNWDDDIKKDSITSARQWKRLNINKGGLSWEVQNLCFEDPHLQLTFEMKCLSELDQAVNRARVYSETSSKRHIYILSNIATSLQIDEVMNLNQDSMPKTLEKLVSSAQDLLNNNTTFSRKDLQEASCVSRGTINNHMSNILYCLDLEEVTIKQSGKILYKKRLIDNTTPSVA